MYTFRSLCLSHFWLHTQRLLLLLACCWRTHITICPLTHSLTSLTHTQFVRMHTFTSRRIGKRFTVKFIRQTCQMEHGNPSLYVHVHCFGTLRRIQFAIDNLSSVSAASLHTQCPNCGRHFIVYILNHVLLLFEIFSINKIILNTLKLYFIFVKCRKYSKRIQFVDTNGINAGMNVWCLPPWICSAVIEYTHLKLRMGQQLPNWISQQTIAIVPTEKATLFFLQIEILKTARSHSQFYIYILHFYSIRHPVDTNLSSLWRKRRRKRFWFRDSIK